MDTVIVKQTNKDPEVTSVINSSSECSSKLYTTLIPNTSAVLKTDVIYTMENQESLVPNSEFQTVLNCDTSDKMNSYDNCFVVKTEQVNFKTDDESMAVEALRQLGGMYNADSLPMLVCSTCNTKFQTTADLNVHITTCKTQYHNYTCSACNATFETEQNVRDHNCIQGKFVCRFCNKYFMDQNILQEHIDCDHNTERPYECHVCKKKFPRPSSLTNHLKIHNYQPGRALLNVDSNNLDIQIWSNSSSEQLYLDPLSSWNYNYNTENSSSDFIQMDSEVSYPNPVKTEVYSFASETEKNMDESFPISSIPQMEVIVNSDSNKPHVCTQCGMAFSREKALKSHIKLHMMDWPSVFECESCTETFPDENYLVVHRKTCSSNKNTDDNIITLPEKQKVIKRSSSAKIGKHPCPDCDKRFATKQKMFRHMWIHRKKIFTCELCAMTFEVQQELDKHRLSKHPADSPYVCQECGKSFASRQGLWEHGRTHGTGNAGLFSCNKCNKTFASRQGYLIHNRTHTGERPYGCRYCMKAFRDGGTLRKHERIHTGERPHVCPICLHDFNQKVVLREHVRWVHVANKTENENGSFICQICSLNVSDREELCAHIVKHSDLMAAEAKDKKINDKSVKKVKENIINKVENTPPVKQEYIITDSVLEETKNSNLNGYSSERCNVECDLCRKTFLSVKELMTHVHIHI